MKLFDKKIRELWYVTYRDLYEKVPAIKLIKKPLRKQSARNLRWPYNMSPNCMFIGS